MIKEKLINIWVYIVRESIANSDPFVVGGQSLGAMRQIEPTDLPLLPNGIVLLHLNLLHH